jgi:peptidylprolyl isomerase
MFPSERSTVRKVLGILLPALLLLTACGGGGNEAGQADRLDAVTVTVEDESAAPKVEVDGAITVDEPTAAVLVEGDGEEVQDGQTVTYRIVGINTEDGSALGDTYAEPTGQDLLVDETLKTQDEALYTALLGAKVGSQIGYMQPASSEMGNAGTELLVFKIEGVKNVPTRAEGEAVPPVEGLPTVELAEDGEPSITIPESEAPTELVSQDLIKGSGAEVKETDSVTVQYRGVKWSNGETFDSSWERGQPASFGLQQVVEGWKQGLTGKTVGSQVLVIVPPALGYGGSEGHDLQNETLVFVVDILDAKSA